jgi:hypothetical protein
MNERNILVILRRRWEERYKDLGRAPKYIDVSKREQENYIASCTAYIRKKFDVDEVEFNRVTFKGAKLRLYE